MKTILFHHDNDLNQPNEAKPDYIIRDFAELPATLDFFGL